MYFAPASAAAGHASNVRQSDSVAPNARSLDIRTPKEANDYDLMRGCSVQCKNLSTAGSVSVT
jgi:hypothetical protein